MNNPLLTLAVLVILPMIPALILFKFLPSRAVVKGPLAGLDVKFGGAFGGYVAIMVFVAMYFSQNMSAPTYRTWQVSGAVEAESNAVLRSDDISCVPVPPLLHIAADRNFRLEMPMPEGQEMPDLFIQAPGYLGQTVQLAGEDRAGTKRYEVRIDKEKARIVFKEPIVLRKAASEPAYTPNVAAMPLLGGS